jgi:uncharacterized repeat protein (TIGR03803 family)
MKRIALLAVVVCLGPFAAGSLIAAATLTTLHIFNETDGNAPKGALVLGTNGNFYGITQYGGTSTNFCIGGCGTVFEISPGGAFTSRHSFTNYDGSDPRGGLAQGSDGNLYGTTAAGGFFGPGGLGTVFRMTPSGVITTIHSFDIGGGGIGPEGDLIEGRDGDFYGTTAGGGAPVGGVFRITTNGVFKQLVGVNQPGAGVIQGSDGNFYGTAQFGGSSTNCIGGCGVVFKITPNGVLTTLHSFDGSDGSWPLAGLVQGSDGNLYGTTSGGVTSQNCSNGCGTVFQITTNGDFTTLHAFTGPEGREPHAGLVQGSDGNFYGTAYAGGASFFGTVFQMTTNGVVTRLISFNALNGGNPTGALVQDSNGVFYGTTEGGGGTNGLGTVFKLSLQTNAVATVSCVLSPAFATNIVGATNTVIATVTSNGVARSGALVNFRVAAGPNRGQTGAATTSASGQASFSYTGSFTPGSDTIGATSLGAIGLATTVWIAPDSVGDGIPDWWRAQYFGANGTTTNSQSCASCDADGTGQNNLFKYVAGLNPTNPVSVFVLSVQNVNGQPTRRNLIYDPIAAGRTYTPQFRTNLASGAWKALTGFSASTNINQATITDRSATQASKFYRIGISLP